MSTMESKNSAELFMKIHRVERLSRDKLSVDIEVLAVGFDTVLSGRTVELEMNGKTHRLATMVNGRLRAELIFPLLPGARQQLNASLTGLESAGCRTEVVPPGYELEICEGPGEAIVFDDVLAGRRPLRRGEVLSVPKGFYDVTGDLKIQRGGRLVMDAGVTLEFAENAGVHCEGVLEALGTEKEPVTFTAIGSHWRNILVYGRHVSGTRMSNCVIEHGGGRALKRNEARDEYLPEAEEPGSGAETNGGGLLALYTRDADVMLEYLVIRENQAINGKGGGIYLKDSSLNIRQSRIIQNKADSAGGGIFIAGKNSGNASFNGCIIARNQSGADGGGIYLDGVAPEMAELVVCDNHAEFGGGLYHNNLQPEELELINCKIEENVSEKAPGEEEPQDICGSWPS